MVVTRGKVHNFVGMDVTFKKNSTVEVMMKDCIIECFEDFSEEIDKAANTPAKHYMFKSTESIPFSVEKIEIFHHIVAKLVYIPKRARVNIDLAVSYLCTLVSCSTYDYWENPRRLLHYLNDIIDMPRIIRAEGSMDILQTYVDASYAIHGDMKGHTGG